MISVVLFAIFCFSVFIVFYSYVLFPLILRILAKGRSFQFNDLDRPEGVSVLISAYNEESVIREKIRSVFDTDYPADKIEILIGSDSSTDGTIGIVNELMEKESRLRLFKFNERRGKPSVINDLMEHAKFPFVILTDANVYFEKNTIAKLFRHFSESSVGLVGANILNVGMRKDGISMQEKSYIQRENLIKYHEGLLWGTMMGPFGGCYMIRKELFEKVPADSMVDDFYISMKILEKGFKCRNELSAICYEDVPNEMKVEFRRKARISSGNFQNLSRFSTFLLNPFSMAGFCFISHKLIRWITPLFLLSSLICLFFLIPSGKIFLILFSGEIFLLLSPLLDLFLKKIGLHFKFIRFIAYFSYMNLALIKGYFDFRRGIKSGVWVPTKRN
ncbi:MAG: glycosyltransferase [Bacteroidota bacterium]